MATHCSTQFPFSFQAAITVGVDGGSLTSDVGLLLVGEFDDGFGLTRQLDEAFDDVRSPERVHHSALCLLHQPLHQIAASCEDADDEDLLCFDPLFQTLVRGSSHLTSPFPDRTRWIFCMPTACIDIVCSIADPI
jgi:hypothetical protein